MRFDLDRALAFASHFDALRLPGSFAEREAAEILATELAKAGLNVRRGEIDGFVPHEPGAAEVWVTASLAIGAGVALQLTSGVGPGRSTPWVLAAIFLGLAVAGIVLRLAILGWRGGRSIRSPFIAAEMPRDAAEPATTRVVVLSHLETRPPVAAFRFRRDLLMLDGIWLAALWVPCLVVGGWAWLTTAGPALLIGLGLITVVRRVDPWTRRTEPYPADNRTGLATLIELARGWPRNASRGAEVWFLAAGTPVGSWPAEVRASLWPSRPAVPTLAINLEAPGLGDVIFLAGRDGAIRLAEAAARDLWLPAQAGGWPSVPLDHRPLSRDVEAALSLVGDLDATRTEPKLLTASAQLTAEIALRWVARSSPEAVEETTRS